MILRTLPYLIKHHGSTKYFVYIISSFRYNGKNFKQPSNFVSAAPSQPGASPLKKSKCDCFPKDRNSGVKIVGGSSYVDNNETFNNEESRNIVQQYSKPVDKADFTNTFHNVTGKASAEEQPIKEIKLLNAIKPIDLEWQKQIIDIKSLPKHYKSLSKIRLTGLVVLTTLAGYGMAPGAVDLSSLLFMILGTGLTSAAANSINQILEVPYDSQMARTKNRVLTRGLLSPLHASLFAACSATLGLMILYFGTNALTAALGATNLLLYTSVYTPLKRCSISNTWLGSVVGAIPPLMGWAACTGTIEPGGLLLAAILYAWQFPHFNALSWNLRSDYSKAGYRMTSVVNPDLCRKSALRYSILMLSLCTTAPVIGLTTWTFAFDSLPLNCYLIYCAWQFYQKGNSSTSRKLFRFSLIYLPALMFLMFIGKKYSSNHTVYKNSIKISS